MLSKEFRIKPSEIGFCGIKDKRAISFQFITIPIKSIDLIEKIKNFKHSRISIYPIKYVSKKISTLDLLYNSFNVIIRKTKFLLDNAFSITNQIINEIKGSGILNYYGYQRFGVKRPINHIVGKYLLKNDFEKTIKYFLAAYSKLEENDAFEARKMLSNTWNYKEAFNIFPKRLLYERRVLSSLIKEENYIKCFRALPLRLRKLFIQSYSSLIFNKTISKICEYDIDTSKIMNGDLVLMLNQYHKPIGKILKARAYNLNLLMDYVSKGKAIIVLPVLGYKIKMPENIKGQIIREIMLEEGINEKDFIIKKMPEISFPGGYRALRIKNFEIFSEKKFDKNEEVIKVSMKLPSGVFAITVLRDIMKNLDPLTYYGFQENC
ncbi:MAG: tRNA pseudouridine(13) synthase TruD [Nitrososphaerota archaeon]